MYTPSIEGTLRVDPLASGIAMITAYLLDWTLCDDQGPVDIKGLSLDDLTNVLDNLDNETFTEIKNAVEAHEAAMIAVRLQEKKDRDGAKSAPETCAIAVRCGWRVDWVRDLDPDDYAILNELLKPRAREDVD